MTPHPSAGDELLQRLRAGDGRAADVVFCRFFGHLVQLAHRRLYPRTRAKEGPEDVVQSAFKSFFHRLDGGQFELNRPDDVLALLITITLRKCVNRNVKYSRVKRDPTLEVSIDEVEVLAKTPQPDEEAVTAETLEELTRSLDDRERAILALYLEGLSNEQIAERLETSERTVRRTLQEIRESLEAMQQRRTGT